MVPGLGAERKGRRKYLRVLPHHVDCNDAVAARDKKYEEFDARMQEESEDSEEEGYLMELLSSSDSESDGEEP